MEGLREALQLYVKPNMKISIYILGDDYTGSSYDPVLKTIAGLNTDKRSGKPLPAFTALGSIISKAAISSVSRPYCAKSQGKAAAPLLLWINCELS